MYVTVTEPQFVDHGEVSIAIPPNGSQVSTEKSAAAADWTVWSDNEDVATVDPTSASSAKDAIFTITATGKEGDVTTCVASNKYSKWTYKVGIDSHTEIDRKEINFASGATEKWTKYTCEKGKTTWYAWTDRPDLVEVKIESADPRVGFAAVRPGDAEKVTDAASVKLTITHELTNPSGTAMVYVQADGDNICHEVKVVCDVVNCVYVPLKHSDDGEDPESWYEIPEEWAKPAEDATDDEKTWGYDFSASSDKEIAEIKVKDGKFYLHAPADGRDGETRVTFVKSEADVINPDKSAKIWMFYASVCTVEVERFLTFPEEFDSNKEALLNIRAHYLNNVKEEPTPKVLFVVTGCSSHDLNRDKVRATVSNVCQRADVDFYLFKPGQSVDEVAMQTVTKGTQNLTNDDLGMTNDFGGNQHSCLNGFYSLFYKLAKDPAKRYSYDYIVMEFDSQRLAAQDHAFYDDYEANPAGSPNREVVVAEWLNEYYEGIKDSDGAASSGSWMT